MSDVSGGPGWWQASDGRWYPPEQHPDHPRGDGATRPQHAAGPEAAASDATAPHTAVAGTNGGAPAAGGSGSGGARVVTLLAVVVVLMAAVVAGVLLLGDDEAEAAGVRLEAADEPGPDPFYEGLEPARSASLQEFAAQLSPLVDESADVDDPDGPVDPDGPDGPDGTDDATGPRLAGATPGLYGGTRDATSCDVDQLSEFLGADGAKAEAWAGALGLETDRIDEYLERLTPAVLSADTRVRNHGFVDGVATPHEAVLQRGTAVLVDWRGAPRVRCSCGNPLLEPTVVPGEEPTGEPWPNFAIERVVIVDATDTDLATLELVDIETGELFLRPVGSSGDADTSTEPEPEPEPEPDAEPVGRSDAEQCGTFVREGSGEDWSVIAGPGTTVTCDEALSVGEEYTNTHGGSDVEIRGWTCTISSPDGAAGDVFGSCTSPDGTIDVVWPDEPDEAVGDGLGGPAFEDCGQMADPVTGISIAVRASGPSCAQAMAVVEEVNARNPDSMDPDGTATWLVGEWTCTATPGLAIDDLFGSCTSPAGLIEVTLP